MIKNIAKQILPPILYSTIQFVKSKKKSNISYSPSWHYIKNGNLKGREIFIDTKDECWQKEIIEGDYDHFFFECVKNLSLQGVIGPIKGATIWDVGAHIGYHSLVFADLVGSSGHVVAFEPNPYNIERFRQNLKRNEDLEKCITIMCCALGNADGEEEFVFSSEIDNGRSSGSHLKQVLAPEENDVYQSFIQKKIPVATTDTLLKENRIPSPNIIKIDVEGAEVLVLEGAKYLLKMLKPILLIEVHNITAMHDTLNILLKTGYKTRIIDDALCSLSRCFIVAQPEE